jgi:hypothetical protein
MSTAISADSSYITHSPNVCGGQPVIAGTRTPVKSDVQLQFAAEHDRALLTFSTTHYLNLHQVWLQADKKHAGSSFLINSRSVRSSVVSLIS